MPAVATTTLPDVGQPSLGNGVEDEIAVDWTDVINYGQYRIQVEETDTGADWSSSDPGWVETTVGEATSSTQITGREDGEEYRVRMRTETEHRTGAWTTPTSIVTKFPGATGLAAANVTQTSLDLSWSDNSDNEDGFDVERRRQYSDGSFGPWTTVAALAPNTTTHTDSTVVPGRTYEYRIEAFTEHTEANSGTIQVTTTDPGVRQRDVPASGWYVEIEHPDRSTPRILQPGAEAQPRQTLNGLPEVVIPVRKASHWADSDAWERQPMRVWRDGDRLPIERLRAVRETAGGVELVGDGGHELRQRFDDSYQDTNAHAVMRDVIDGTSYARTVDAAPTTTDDLFETLSQTSEFQDLTTATDTTPADFSNNEIAPARVSYLETPGNISTAKLVSNASENWTASEALELDASAQESVSWTIDLDYALDASDWSLWLRDAEDQLDSFLYAAVDGTRVYDDFRGGTTANETVSWTERISSVRTASGTFDLDAGQHTITLELSPTNPDTATTANGSGFWYVDMPCLFDTRYLSGNNFSNTLDANNLLDGKPGVYAPVPIDFQIRPILRATGGRLEATLSSTANGQSLGISSDGGDSYTTAANSTTVDTDFSDDIASWLARVTLGGVDGTLGDSDIETSLTTYRTDPQTCPELRVEHDSLDSPGVSGAIDDSREAVLTDLVGRADALWEVQWDDSVDGIRVVVTKPGQRTTDADPSVGSYEVERDAGSAISEAIVYGRTVSETAEAFTGDLSGVALDNDDIQRDSDRVYDPDTGTVFEEGEDADYTIEWPTGIISITDLTSGMTDGEQYEIDYTWKPQGRHVRSASFDQPLVETINALTSDAECQQAARFLTERLGAPQWSATVTLDRQALGFNLVDQIAPSRLPTPAAGGFRIEGIESGPQNIVLTLGSRPGVGDVVARIEASLSQTARET